jgi:flagellar hook protein FlgE
MVIRLLFKLFYQGDNMAISQALYTGVTGLSVNSDGMSVIANNIANANAKGFKRDRAEFEDLLSMDMSSGAGPTQIGRGSRLRNVRTIHTQGGLKVTDNLTDLAIQGTGFFVVSNPDTEVQESAGKFFTRVGSLSFDKEGYLSDGIGGRIQGYLSDTDGELSSRLTDVRIQTNNIPPKATQELQLNIQLDSRSEIMSDEDTPWDPKDPQKTSNFNTTVSIFDSQGTAHQLTTYFRKMSADNEEGSEWQWIAMVDGKEIKDPPEGQEFAEIGRGSVKFDKYGFLLEENQEEFKVTWNNGSFPDQEMVMDFGTNIGDEEGNGINSSTSIAANSITVYHQQNGFEAGNLQSLRIDQNGEVFGVFTNGLERKLAAIALATFENVDGLEKAGKNMFYSTVDSGPPKIGMPQTLGRGSLYASTLEESNVDLANEFVNMIMTQRLFQANSRSITTTDTMIEEVVNLKR